MYCEYFILGFDIVCTRAFEKGEFLLEYRGMLKYEQPNSSDTYVFEFTHQDKFCWWV